MNGGRGSDLVKRTKRFALRIIRVYSALPKTDPLSRIADLMSESDELMAILVSSVKTAKKRT